MEDKKKTMAQRTDAAGQSPAPRGAWRASLPLKVFVFVLACALAFMLFVLAASSRTNLNADLDEMLSDEYLDDVDWGAYSDATGAYLRERFSGSGTNVRIRVSRIDTDGTETALLDTLGDSGWSHEYDEVFARDALDAEDGGYDYEQLEDMTADEFRIRVQGAAYPSAYAVRLYIVKPLAAQDAYASVLNAETLSERLGRSVVPLACGLAAAFAALVLLSFFMTGRTKEGVRLCWYDRIPFEIQILLTLAPLGAAGWMEELPVYEVCGMSGVLGIGAALEAAGILLFLLLLSAARRIKTRTFAEGFLTFRFLRWVGGLRYAGRWVPAVMTLILVGTLAVLAEELAEMSDAAYLLLFIPAAAASAVLFYHLWMTAELQKSVDALHDDISHQVPEEKTRHMTRGMKRTFARLNDLSEAMEDAVDERMKSERLRAELITNVSHDIRTPLTSILTYVDLLKKDPTPEQAAEYVDVLDRQARRLQKLTEDVLEASKADSGNIDVRLAATSVPEIVDQAVAEYREKFDDAGLTVVTDTQDAPDVTADGRLLWRVLRNLLSNAAKYSLAGTRVYIDAAETEDGRVRITIRNISREPLNIPADELMERFVRGDRSRHSEGSGLGLDIARSLTALQGGTLDLSIDGDMFKASVILPKA